MGRSRSPAGSGGGSGRGARSPARPRSARTSRILPGRRARRGTLRAGLARPGRAGASRRTRASRGARGWGRARDDCVRPGREDSSRSRASGACVWENRIPGARAAIRSGSRRGRPGRFAPPLGSRSNRAGRAPRRDGSWAARLSGRRRRAAVVGRGSVDRSDDGKAMRTGANAPQTGSSCQPRFVPAIAIAARSLVLPGPQEIRIRSGSIRLRGVPCAAHGGWTRARRGRRELGIHRLGSAGRIHFEGSVS